MEYKLKKDVIVLSPDLELEEYLPYVKEEVKIIKEHFSKDLIESTLSIPLETIDGANLYNCIYGKLTGNCYSNEAHGIIFKLPVVIDNNNRIENFNENYTSKRGMYFLSPLEHYITPFDYESNEKDDTDFFPESYLKRVKKVVDLLREN